MSKLDLFRDFLTERLAAAALEIFEQFEKTLVDCEEEIRRSQEENIQRIYVIRPDIKIHQSGVQQFSLPEPLQIKEEQELWTSQGGEQLQELQSDTTDSIFNSPSVKPHCDPENLSQLPPLDQTPTVESREGDSQPTNTTEEKLKAESDEEDYGASNPVSESQPQSLIPDWPTAQSLEEEETGGLLPERKLMKSRRTRAKCSRPYSSPGPCIRTKTRPSSWTRPISSSHSGSESEEVSSGEAESKSAQKPFQSVKCDKAFNKKINLANHRITHTGGKTHQCEECDQTFRQRRSVVIHKSIHSGGKRFQCEECDQAFRLKCNLVNHRRIHTGEKPFQCAECSKAFSLKRNLIDHRRIHTGEKPYQCEECDQAFRHKLSLVNHRRIHSGEKPYRCEECDQAFRLKGNLVKHRRIHTGDKPYQCEECDQAFRLKGSLVHHKRTHTREEPYQ